MTKKIKIIFTLSFILNIVLIGVLLGVLSHAKPQYRLDNIEGSAKEVLRANMDKKRDAMQANHEKMNVYKKKLQEIMIAPEFNREDFDKVMNDILTIKNDIEDIKSNVFGDALSELSQQDRELISENLLRKLSKKPRKPREK